MAQLATLERYLEDWAGDDASRAVLAEAPDAIAGACRAISELIARGPLAGALGAVHGDNMDGDARKELDPRANELVIDSLHGASIAVGLEG